MKRQENTNTLTVALCHLAFWFGLLFATPLFIASNNPEDLDISISTLGFGAGLLTLVLTMLGVGISRFSGPRVRYWLPRLLVAAAFVLAAQGNVIHDLFEYGAFNGETVNFRKYGAWFAVEALGWFLAFPLLIWLFSRFSKLPAWLPLIPIASFALHLVPALVSAEPQQPRDTQNEIIDPSVFSFSSKGNLVHLLPDGFQSDVVRQVLEEDSALADRFRGFTLFTQHAGRYPGTAPSVHTLLTGEPFDFKSGWDYKRLMPYVKENSYQNQLIEAGYQVDYVPISGFVCIDAANSCHSRPFNDMKARGLYRHEGSGSWYSIRLLADLSLFRLTPLWLKEKIHNKGYWFLADTTLDGSSPLPDPVLHEWSENIQVIDSHPVYKWYHYVGTHIPPRWDRQCRLQRDLPRERDNYLDQARCVLGNIASFLDVLESRGLYDQTAMLISGDHGHNTLPIDQVSEPLNHSTYKGILGTGRPALLVKRKDSRAPLQFSTQPTDMLNIVPTLLELGGLESAAETVFEVPEDRQQARIFQMYAIDQFWTGKPIPYVEYQVTPPLNSAQNWAVADIRNYRDVPSSYDPVNKKTADGFMMGAQLRSTIGKTDSAWVRGRQLAFLIELEGEPRPRRLELALHLTDWMPRQSLAVSLNHGNAVPSGTLVQVDEGFWQTVSVELPVENQLSGRNFISIIFDQAWPNPDADNWYASALLKSVYVRDSEHK